MTDATGDSIVSVKNLEKSYSTSSRFGKKLSVRAVDGVSFDIRRGTTMGLVGESGCGKSTLGRAVLNLEQPSAGEVLFEGQSVLGVSRSEWRALRRRMQLVFQDPFSSLNGRKRVRTLLEEPFRIHGVTSEGNLRAQVDDVADLVGLSKRSLEKYPHEFSGGQRQRIVIARAIALRPSFVVCDEPVSALDVSVQSQVMNLFRRLQSELGLTYLFISHDLSVVRYISDQIGVMYLGKIVELGTNDQVMHNAHHPYTHALLSSIPVPHPTLQRARERIVLQGDLPSPINPPSGCRFHTRCPFANDVCKVEVPELRELELGHWVACHFPYNVREIKEFMDNNRN